MAIRFTFQDSLQQGLQRSQRRNETREQEERLQRQQQDLQQFRAAQIFDQQTARRLQEQGNQDTATFRDAQVRDNRVGRQLQRESNRETVRRNKEVARDKRAQADFDNELIDVSDSLRAIGLGEDLEGEELIPRRSVSAYFTAAANTYSANLRRDAAIAKAAESGSGASLKNRPYSALPDSRFEEDFFRMGVMQLEQQGGLQTGPGAPTSSQANNTTKIMNDFYAEGKFRPEAAARVRQRLNIFQTGKSLRAQYPAGPDGGGRESSTGFYNEIRRLRTDGVLTDAEAFDMIQQFVGEGRVDPLESFINQ